MKTYILEREQLLPISVDEAWDFFSSPKNLSKITPDYMGFEIKSELPPRMYSGLKVAYTVKPLLGLPMRWVSEIDEVDEPKYFVDRQLKGPYKLWVHQHFIEETSKGVKVSDRVEYALPLGILGQIAHWLFVKRQLNGIFDYRKKVLSKLFSDKPSLQVA